MESKTSKLLIVDDEEDVREFAARFFKRRNIEVITANNGEEALAKIKSEKPNLVLLDISMPVMDGLATLQNLRTLNDTTKVVMVTGKKPQEDDTLKKCHELGALEYVHKPLELDELEKIVLTLLK